MTAFSLLVFMYFLSLFGLINFARTWSTLFTYTYKKKPCLFSSLLFILLLLPAFFGFLCYFFSELLRCMLSSLILSCCSYISSSGYKFVSLLFTCISQDLIWRFCYHALNIYHFHYGFLFDPWIFLNAYFN